VPIVIGSAVPDLAIEVYNSSGALANAGAVSLDISLDGVSLATLTPTNPATGKYQVSTYIAAASGLHVATWTLSGANAGSKVQSFYVDSASASVGIVSLAEVKNHLNIKQNTYDDKLNDLILTAASICESSEGTGITWRRTVVTNEIHSVSGSTFSVHRRPITSLTTIVVDGVTGSVADYDFDAGTGIVTAYAVTITGTRGRNVSISYVAGGGAIPRSIRDGNLEHVRFLYGIYRGGSGLPRTAEPDYTQIGGYLIPNRVVTAYRTHSGLGF
jgi:hypothetical protein